MPMNFPKLPNLQGRTDSSSDRSFLPEDYIQKRAARRTNLLALTLFGIVTSGVVGAFLVTNREWKDVKHYQEAINVRYAQAAKDIEHLKILEAQRDSLLERAELTTALIERVPKTILLAELTNRMPLDVTLLELELKSTRIIPPAATPDPKDKKGQKKADVGKASRTAKGDAKESKTDDKPPVLPPRFKTKVILTGVTNSHDSVAHYVSSLQGCGLLAGVELKISEKVIIEEQNMTRFRIEADIAPDADSRRIAPLATPRLTPDAFGSQTPAAPAASADTADALENNP